MNIIHQISAVLLVATLSSSNILKSGSTGSTFELLILHNNDMHARFEQTSQLSGTCTVADREAGKCYGGFPRVAHVVKEARKAAASGEGPPVLYLNAGDTYTGTVWFTTYKWKIAAEFLNALQPDAVSLGNHEFDNGINGLTPFIENLNCPILAANLDLTKVPVMANQSNLKKSVVFDIAGVKIGIVGYLTPETKLLAIHNDVEYVDEIEAIRSEVKLLEQRDVNIIIALGHSGYSKDLEIAKEVKGIDLVIGGHTNTFLWNGTSPDSEDIEGSYPSYVTQKSGKQVPVVQAYAYTKYMGKMNIIFNKDGEIESLKGNPLLLDQSIPQDSEIVKIVERYQSDSRNVANVVVGNTSVLLEGPKSCKVKECNLGNLIADSLVYRYSLDYKQDDFWTDAPIAIVQNGGIRASIAHTQLHTEISKGELFIVMPFSGNVVTMTMNGSILMQVLEHSVKDYGPYSVTGSFLQFSGVKVVYDLSRPIYSRVVKAEARCGKCKVPEYSEIESKKLYKIIMPDFIAHGGDGFNMLAGLSFHNLPYDELACTELYISKHSPIVTGIEGRITFVNEIETSASSLTQSPSFIFVLLSVLSFKLSQHKL